MESRLICTANEELICKNKKNIFISDWCLQDDSVKKKILNLDYEICSYHYNHNQKKLKSDWAYLNDLYERVMIALTLKLNEYHKKNFSRKYWEIIVGPTIVQLLSIFWDRWETIIHLKKNFKINEVAILRYELSNCLPKDFEDLFTNKLDDHYWNNCIFSEILKDSFKIKIMEIIPKKNKDLKYNKKNQNIISYLKYFIDLFLGKIIKEKILFYKFSKKKYLNFIIKKFRLSRFYYEFSKQISTKKKIVRKNINLGMDSKNSFEEMLNRKLFNFIPISHLELFEDINVYLNKIKIKPKYIVTTYGHVINDLFKIWSAEKIEKKISKIVICSHGGTFEDKINFNSWMNISDNFITWEKKTNIKCIQLPPTYSIEKKNIKKTKNKQILFCTANTNLYNYRIQDYIISSQMKTYVSFWKEFIKRLNYKTRNILIIRHIPNIDPWHLKEEFEKILGNNAISKKKNFLDEVKNSKIIIHTALQTTFFESMLAGVPSVVLLKEDMWNLSKSGREIYKLLKKNKIIFKDIESLINHLNNIDQDPLSWWNSKNILIVRQKFHEHFCNYQDDNKWNNYFLDLN